VSFSFSVMYHARSHNAKVPSTPRQDETEERLTAPPSKLATTIATTFTVEYAMQWPLFFPDQPLSRPYPTFDGRTVLYPKLRILRDYLSWRQADCKACLVAPSDTLLFLCPSFSPLLRFFHPGFYSSWIWWGEK